MRAQRMLPKRTLARHASIAAVAAVLLFLLTLALDPFTNFKLSHVAFLAIAAAGLSVLTGANGQLSLGHGALMAVGAYATSVLLQRASWVTVPGVIVLAILITTIVGAIVGVAAARLRGPYLAGATLALAIAVPTIATHWSGVFGGEQGLSVAPLLPPAGLSAVAPERWFAWIALLGAIVALVLLANLTRSRYGRMFRAVRDDEIAAALAGIRVARTQIVAFVVSAACAGLAGSLLAFWGSLTAPAGFGLELSLELLTAIVIGGIGTLSGAVLGALVLVLVPGWSSGIADRLHLASAVRDNIPVVLYGGVLIAAMLSFPRGMVGGLQRLAARIRRARRSNLTV